MNNSGRIIHRVTTYLNKQFKKKGWIFESAPDLRQQGKITHPLGSILWSSLLGLISNQKTLRDVEEMTHNLNEASRKLIPRPISDTTLDNEIRRLDCDYLLSKLVQQNRDAHRSKMLNPVGLPCGVATVDGKNLATLDHDADGTGQKRSSENEKWQRKSGSSGKPYWLMPALRATLTSAEAKPALYQKAIPPGAGESTTFKQFVDELHSAYGRSTMFGIIDGDAGLTSLANADHIDSLGYGYVLGLKGNQPELEAEAHRLLSQKAVTEEPEAQTPWELRNGKRIRRRLWRSFELKDWYTSAGCWKHLRQVWLIRQETTDKDGIVAIEDRFFVSSVLPNYLKPKQILRLVRGHWGIEGDCFNSLDVQWNEDSAPWCTQGTAIWSLGILRLMAYNVVQYLRKRRLRHKESRGHYKSPLAWRSVFKLLIKAFEYHHNMIACEYAR